jgi:hypothetical protein
MKILLVVLAALLFGAMNAQSLKTIQWQADVREFATSVERLHKNAFHSVSKSQWKSAVAALEKKLRQLSDHEVVVELMRLCAMIGDGHTFVFDPNQKFFRVRFPLYLERFGEAVYLTQSGKAAQKGLGGRLIAINDLPITTVFARLDALASKGEGQGWVRYLRLQHILQPEILHALGIIKTPKQATFVFDLNGVKQSITLTPSAETLHLEAAKTVPLRRAEKQKLWLRQLETEQTLYVALHGYPGITAFFDLARQLTQALKTHQPRKVVMDFRQNTGGDMTQFSPIVSVLQDGELMKQARLYALIGDPTFSAAMANTIELKQLGAVLVGEATGGRPNQYSENRFFLLTHSGLTVSVSSLFHRFLPNQNSPALPPDVLAPLSWEAYLNGQDDALEAVFADKN